MADPTPTARAHGRSLSDFGKLSVAEKELLACVRSGDICFLDNERPEAATKANTIRAGLVRFLALGGDDKNPVHERGVKLWGAWISGTIEMVGANAEARLSLTNCHCDSDISAIDCSLFSLDLSGSFISCVDLQRAVVARSVFLSGGFETTGGVALVGAQIGGDLSCSGGSFSNIDAEGNSNGTTIWADRMTVAGSVFLSDGFTADGQTRFMNAHIGRNLHMDESSFTDEFEVGWRFAADGLEVEGKLFLRGSAFANGIDLATARVGTLVDSEDCWSKSNNILDGFRYDRIVGPTEASSRIAWLKSQDEGHLNEDFKPQPWEQLIKVPREMGHGRDADEVAIAKQHALRAAKRIGTRAARTDFRYGWRRWLDAQWNDLSNDIAGGAHDAYGWLAGYGYRPSRIILWMLGLWLASAFAFSTAAENGLMAPSNPVLHAHEAGGNVNVNGCGVNGDVGQSHYWLRCPGMPAEYTTFSPLGYAADMILPLVNLQQDVDWGPVISNAKGPLYWGTATRWLGWFDILFGWFASLMFVAIVGRLVERD